MEKAAPVPVEWPQLPALDQDALIRLERLLERARGYADRTIAVGETFDGWRLVAISRDLTAAMDLIGALRRHLGSGALSSGTLGSGAR